MNTPDVWYTFTPVCNGHISLDTCELPCLCLPRFDTVLSAYTSGSGTCGFLTQVPGAFNDDALFPCFNSTYPFSSRMNFPSVGGVKYWIRVSGFVPSSVGAFALAMRLGFISRETVMEMFSFQGQTGSRDLAGGGRG